MKEKIVFFVLLSAMLAWCGRDGTGLHAQTTKIAPEQLRAPRLTILACHGPVSPTQDCTGTYYLDVITPAGTELKLVAVPSNLLPPLDPKVWSVVP